MVTIRQGEKIIFIFFVGNMKKKCYESPVTDFIFTGTATSVLLASGVGANDDDMGKYEGGY